MSSKTAFTWKSYHDRMNDVDPDLRQMALFDLTNELGKKDFQLGGDEDRVVQTVLNCFTIKESNSEVHSYAVKILPPLLAKATKRSNERLVVALAKAMWEPVAEATQPQLRALRENASMALRTITSELVLEQKDIAVIAVANMMPGLANADVKVKIAVQEVLTEVVKKFGAHVPEHLPAMQESSLAGINGSDAGLRKTSSSLLAAACEFTPDALFAQVMEMTISNLRQTGGDKRRHILLCSAISRNAGSRFASNIEAVVPELFKELRRLAAASAEESEGAMADETRENILQALESFILRCPSYISAAVPEIVQECARLVSWDPNYCDDAADGEADDDDDQQYEDEDDSSWRVRKSAIRCLLQLLKSRPDTLALVFNATLTPANPLLVSRLHERVENVRLEVFELFHRLLELSRLDSGPTDAEGTFVHGSFSLAGGMRPEAEQLLTMSSNIVRGLIGSAKNQSPKVKVNVFALLHDVVLVLGTNVAPNLAECVQLTVEHLENPKLALPQLRPDVLKFARCLAVLAQKIDGSLPIVQRLFTPVCRCTEDRFFRTVVAAIKVCHELVGLLRQGSDTALVTATFRCLAARLATGDVDHEVKKAAIDAVAMTLRFHEAALRTTVGAEVETVHESLLTMLRGDSTRASAARAFMYMARCSFKPATIKAVLAELTVSLRKADRQVREAALRALVAVIPAQSANIDAPTYQGLAQELANDSNGLLSDKELFVASLSLQLATAIAKVPGSGSVLASHVLPKVHALLGSHLVQGNVVRDASDLYKALVLRAEVPQPSLLTPLVDGIKRVASPAAAANLAAVIGVTVAVDGDAARQRTNVQSFCDLARTLPAVGVLSLGEIGRYLDVCTVVPAAKDALRGPLFAATAVEDVRQAAASACGRAASVDFGTGLFRQLMTDLDNADGRYFVLRAIREAVTSAVNDGAASSICFARDPAMRVALQTKLLSFASVSAEQNFTEVSADCIGRIAQLNPETIGELAAISGSSSSVEDAISISLTAMRFAVSGPVKPAVDAAIATHLHAFLGRIHVDQPLSVRRQSLRLLYAIAYSKPQLLRSEQARSQYLPRWLDELSVDARHVTEVDLGPFKHKVDRGLDGRKIAFEILSCFCDGLERPNSVLEFAGLFEPVADKIAAGLKDPDFDIAASVRGSMLKFAAHASASASLATKMDLILVNLKSTVLAKDAADQDRMNEISKNAIATVFKLNKLMTGTSMNPKYKELMEAAEKLAHFAAAKQIGLE